MWRLIPFRQLSAYENMAIDESIFRANQRQDILPTLRFYNWQFPSISIGYFQDVKKEINVEACQKHNIDIVRRPTGGKAVFHDAEITYAVISTEKGVLFPQDILGTYKIISLCIGKGLSNLGINATPACPNSTPRKGYLDASCFSSPSRHELLVNGRKICGSAQVRSHGFFLQHGSILIDFDPVKTCTFMNGYSDIYRKKQIIQLQDSITSIRDHVESDINIVELSKIMKEAFEEALKIKFVEQELTPLEDSLKTLLLNNKYLCNDWNMKGKTISLSY